MDNLIEIYAAKNINKPNKGLKFDDWSWKNYWIDPAIIDYIDPHERTVHCGDNLVFRLWHEKAVDELIKKVNGDA